LKNILILTAISIAFIVAFKLFAANNMDMTDAYNQYCNSSRPYTAGAP
jgi:hypothetical protein